MRRLVMGKVAATLAAVAMGLLLSGCPRVERVDPAPLATPIPVPTPTPPPLPYVPNKKLETGKIFNGMQYRVTLETEFGTTASNDREEASNYAAELTLKVKVPKPHLQFDELQRLNPQLGEVLPALPKLLADAKISPFFDELYRLKCAQLRASLNRLDSLLSRHNFYDTETIVELQHPETKRRALLVQADMDVDEDGSDPDRVPEVDGSSLTFQPFTSYHWPKKSNRVNPFLAGRQARLGKAEQELATGGLPAARERELKSAVQRLKGEIHSLTEDSFLVGAVDPFIVLPGLMVGKASKFSAATGDFCIIVFERTLYPAIVGDVGPAYKSGEAALRICKQISAQADSNNRPMSDLKVTYLVFPGTAEKPFGPPDLEKWRKRCASLLQELGGHGGELFAWQDVTKPKPAEPKAEDSLPPGSLPKPAAAPATIPPETSAPEKTAK